MKKLMIPIICMTVITACNNKTESSTTTETGDSSLDNSKREQLKDAAAEMETKKDELLNLTPYSTDQMNALIPKDLLGAAATDVEITPTMGTSLANATYKVDDSTEIEISIIDCAGAAGSGIYNMQYLSMFGFEEEDEDEYTKTIDFNGGKAFENCKKNKPDCTLTYLSGGRFLVTMEGENVGIEKLKELAKGMNVR